MPSNPRVLVLSCEQTKLTSLSPFQRKDGCDRLGSVRRCERLRDGSLEVEFASTDDAAKALRAKSFTYSKRDRMGKRDVSLPITVVPHRTKNFSKGVISCYELRDTSDEEIVDGLLTSGVTEAKRILVRKGGNTISTNSIILTFDRDELPPDVAVGYTRVRVRPYVPNPMRCFRCQRFGHTRTYCRNRPACGKCASSEHLDEDCLAGTLRCVNCGDGQTPHASYDRKCPAYVREREINSIRATRNVDFREAKRIYNESHPQVSYAQKASAAPMPSKASLEHMSALQLVQMLKSFGLSVVAADSSSLTATKPQAPRSASAEVNSSLSGPCPGDEEGSTSLPDPATAAPARSTDKGDEDWTLVRRRRSLTRRAEPPSHTAAPGVAPGPASRTQGRPPPKETAVMAALRRNEEEKRARDARRARLVERAREARQSPGTDSDPGTGIGAAGPAPVGPEATDHAGRPSSSLSSGSATSMGPPPTPPRRPRIPPPPPPAGALTGDQSLRTPQAAPRALEPPPAPARPGKRTYVTDDSPSEGGTPRSRHRPHKHPTSGRASSADGRLFHGDASHPRIQFRDGGSSGT